MGKYKVKVNIELIECNDDAKEHDPIKEKDGSFTMLKNMIDSAISESDTEGYLRCYNYVMNQISSTREETDEKRNKQIN